MTNERPSDDDEALDAALGALSEPELPAELARRLDAIPARGVVRHFPGRSWRVSALGWAAAAAIGVFIGTQWTGDESAESASSEDTAAESASVEDASGTGVSLFGDAENDDDDLALAVGSFTEFEEEP